MSEIFVMGVRNNAGKSLILQEKTKENFQKKKMKTGTEFAALYSHLIYVLER